MGKIHKILIFTNSQRVLNFFLDYPGKVFVEKEIQKSLGISKSGVNYALKELIGTRFLFMDKKGKMHFYSLNYQNPVVKQLKTLKNVIYLQPVLKNLGKGSSKVIIFGSSSRGEDFADSDIDLYVISNSKKENIEEEIGKLKLKRKIQLVVRTELGDLELKSKDPIFYEQINKGIVLWQKQ